MLVGIAPSVPGGYRNLLFCAWGTSPPGTQGRHFSVGAQNMLQATMALQSSSDMVFAHPRAAPQDPAHTKLTCGLFLFLSNLLQPAQQSIDVGFDLRQLSFDCLKLAALHFEGIREFVCEVLTISYLHSAALLQKSNI